MRQSRSAQPAIGERTPASASQGVTKGTGRRNYQAIHGALLRGRWGRPGTWTIQSWRQTHPDASVPSDVKERAKQLGEGASPLECTPGKVA